MYRDNIKLPSTYRQENEVLAMIMRQPSTLCEARAIISEDLFSDPENKKVWKAYCDADDAGTAISVGTITPKINVQHFIKNILPCGGEGFSLSEASDKCYALLEMSIKRRAALVGIQAYNDAMANKSVTDVLAGLQDFVKSMTEKTSSKESQRLDDALNDLADVISKRAADKAENKDYRITTSFKRLDRACYGGFVPGQLIILAARPSVGKTAYALQMAKHAAMKGHAAQYFSLEMKNVELAQRIALSTRLIAPEDLSEGSVNWAMFETAIGKFTDVPLWLNDKLGHIDEICAKIASASRQGKCDIAFIDYLGLIEMRDSSKLSLYAQVTATTKKLKRIALDCNIPVVLLCQLNRDAAGEEPQLHHLRDSGSIEQDADKVLMLNRNIDDPDEEAARRCCVFIRKNRQGKVGQFMTLMDETCSTIYEIDNPMF